MFQVHTNSIWTKTNGQFINSMYSLIIVNYDQSLNIKLTFYTFLMSLNNNQIFVDGLSKIQVFLFFGHRK